jgi:hypothetical protein
MKTHIKSRPAPVAPQGRIKTAASVSPAELRRQVVEYRGKVSPLGAKLQAAVWAR